MSKEKVEHTYRAMIAVLVAAIIFLLAVGWVTKVQVDEWNKVKVISDSRVNYDDEGGY